MRDACRENIHLKDGVEASQRARSLGEVVDFGTILGVTSNQETLVLTDIYDGTELSANRDLNPPPAIASGRMLAFVD
jgi:hypothetical protein